MLSFESPSPSQPIRPTTVCPSPSDSIPITSAPLAESTSFASEPATSSAPSTSAAPSITHDVSPDSADDSSDDDHDVRPSPSDSAPVTSAPLAESMSVALDPAASSTPSTSAAPMTTLDMSLNSADDSSDDDPDRFIKKPKTTTPSSLVQD